jgi:hypothetical protein
VSKSKFSYETYVATAVETLWKALLEGEFTRQYWGHENISDWKEGSEWEHRRADSTRALVVLGCAARSGGISVRGASLQMHPKFEPRAGTIIL